MKNCYMSDTQPSNMNDPIDIDEVERRPTEIAPPKNLGEAIQIAPNLKSVFEAYQPSNLIAYLAGLATEPQFQANHVRIDWAIRLAFVFAKGKRKPKAKHLNTLLNSKLPKARIARLEDPIESPFIEKVITSRGSFQLITGLWEKAAFHTECVTRAFERLPDHEVKTSALERAYALLKIGDEIARRSGYETNKAGQGQPNGRLAVPSDTRLRILGRRVRFSFTDLDEQGVDPDHLRHFLLAPALRDDVLQLEIGDTPLEFLPLLPAENGCIVAAPQNISTAIRAHLVEAATQHGMGDRLRAELAEVHRDLIHQSRFIDIPPLKLKKQGDFLFSEVLWEESKGRWVHILQSIDGYHNWPETAFGPSQEQAEGSKVVLQKSIRSAIEYCEKQPGYREGITLWFTGGWGRDFNASAIDEAGSPDWLIIPIEPSDAMALGASKNGHFRDIWRLFKQFSIVSAQGFELHNASGILNLFQWWRNTNHKLVPESMTDLRPPMWINFDTDLLLETRIQATEVLDRKALRHPTEGYRQVFLRSRQYEHHTKDHIYIDAEATEKCVPRAAVAVGNVIWWVELKPNEKGNIPEAHFRTWDGLLEWCAKILIHQKPQINPMNATQVVFNLHIEDAPDEEPFEGPGGDVRETVTLNGDALNLTCDITLHSSWHSHLFQADNTAELVAAAAFLRGYSCLLDQVDQNIDFEQVALDAVGSSHYRWRHAMETVSTVEQLNALGLGGKFREIPVSAGAQIQSGSCWAARDPDESSAIEGQVPCIEFLAHYQEALLNGLINYVQHCDLRSLLLSSMNALQAALVELSHWSATANAMRAIHGALGDQSLSMERHAQAYGVIRASSILVEVALAEGAKQDSIEVGDIDLEEMQALALMVFQIGDQLAGICLNRVEPSLKISPTGELLSNHDFEENSIRSSARITNKKVREQDAQRYLRRFEEDGSSSPIDGLNEAISAEFGIGTDALIDIGLASVKIAEKRGEGVFTISRSQYSDALQEFEPLSGIDLSHMLEALTLYPRDSWSDLPDGWTQRDIDIAKLGRRFTLIARPLVALDKTDNPDLIVSPAAINRFTMFVLGGAMDGSLQNEFWRSRVMRRFASSRGNITGNLFNERVAEEFQSLGLEARASVKPSWCLNQKATPQLQQLGDVDVLAVDRNQNTVWVVEAKDIKSCRTIGEAARRLSEYQGLPDKNGKPDKLLRHLNRVTYIRDRVEHLCQRLKLDTTPIVRGLVVVRAPQPLESIWTEVGEDARVVMLDNLPEFFSKEN